MRELFFGRLVKQPRGSRRNVKIWWQKSCKHMQCTKSCTHATTSNSSPFSHQSSKPMPGHRDAELGRGDSANFISNGFGEVSVQKMRKNYYGTFPVRCIKAVFNVWDCGFPCCNFQGDVSSSDEKEAHELRDSWIANFSKGVSGQKTC